MSDVAMTDVITHVRHPGRGLQLRLANVICVSSSADLFSFILKKYFTRDSIGKVRAFDKS